MRSVPKQRVRYGQLPVPAERADLSWSKKQRELVGITDGQLTRLIIDTPEFEEVITPMLDAIDRRNRTGYGNTMGRPSRFTSLHLESVLLYRRVAGLEQIKETRERLQLDLEAQELLDLNGGLPSLKTMSRYMRERIEAAERADLYRELDRRLRQRVCRLPGFDMEARIMGMDGSRQGTRYTPPIPEVNRKGEKTGRFVNGDKVQGMPGAITAATAGYVGGHNPKSGKGWQMVGLWSQHGTLLAWDVSPLNESEMPAAERVLASYASEVLPHRHPQTISVLTADGGFSSNAIRAQAQAARMVPNIHNASHKIVPGTEDDQTENASHRTRSWRVFKEPNRPHYSNWRANGHGELACKCGEGKTKRVFEIGKTGLSIATKGCCSTCGNVTITVGQWRSGGENWQHWVRCRRNDQPDLTLGNSLTFNDPISREYGRDRYGYGESVHATLMHRFGLLDDKSWMRNLLEVQTEFAIAGAAISVLLLEREARRNATETAVSLPPLSDEASGALPLAA